MKINLATLASVALLAIPPINAQDLVSEAKKKLERPELKQAFDYVDANKDSILAEWIALTEINAPSGKERVRAEAIRKTLQSCKLDKIYYDNKGNLIAIRKGTGGAKPTRRA